MSRPLLPALLCALIASFATRGPAQENAAAPRDLQKLPANTWVKLTPLAGGPVSPRLGYEGACVWDAKHERMIRYGGHNQGGGGEQGSEIWSFDPRSGAWKLHEPNISPPGICCGQQNVFDPISGRYIRFPAFSASHGWQWLREVYLNNASVWTYDLAANTWRDMRPYPTAHPSPLRCASWDSEHQVIVMFGGEGNSEGTQVYDPYTNAWTKMAPDKQPAFRSGGNMAYDERSKLHILFGSQFDDDQHTWAYDLNKNAWRDLAPATMPPTDKNDAVLTYDERAGKVLAIIKVTAGKDEDAKHALETWAFDVQKNTWTKLNPKREPDPTSSRARQLLFAPQLGVALLENRPSNSSGVAEQQVWAYRAEQQLPATAAWDSELKIVTTADGARLTWVRPEVKNVAGYDIYRGLGDAPWKVDFEAFVSVPAAKTSFDDVKLPRDKVQHYFVVAVDGSGKELARSSKVHAQPRLVDGVRVNVRAKSRIDIAWKPAAEKDVAGYHLERAVVEVLSDDQHKRLKSQTPPLESPSVVMLRRVGPFQRITKQPIAASNYTDTSIDLTKPAAIEGAAVDQRSVSKEDFDPDGRPYGFAVYAYRVQAVNALGVASGASPAAFTIPAAPEFLFAKEDGEQCHLKWQAHREAGVKYRVYRMDGRYAKDPVARLTPDPIAETTFTDPAAGKPTRRCHIVAVDALGQEGFPSSPAWHKREWEQFYKPFVGEWHQ